MRFHINSPNNVDKHGANASGSRNAILEQMQRRDVAIHRIGNMRLHTNSSDNVKEHGADATPTPSVILEEIKLCIVVTLELVR